MLQQVKARKDDDRVERTLSAAAAYISPSKKASMNVEGVESLNLAKNDVPRAQISLLCSLR